LNIEDKDYDARKIHMNWLRNTLVELGTLSLGAGCPREEWHRLYRLLPKRLHFGSNRPYLALHGFT
jgi:hypothetical protein